MSFVYFMFVFFLRSLFPPGGAVEGYRRVRPLPDRNALPFASDFSALRHGLHAGLRRLPRTHHDVKGN